MLSNASQKPNAVRYFDAETFNLTICRRMIAAVETILSTAQREIEAADLSPAAQDRAGEAYSRLYQLGETTRRRARQEIEIITASALLRGEPDMVPA